MARFSFARRVKHKFTGAGRAVKTKAGSLKGILSGFAKRIGRGKKQN